MDTTMWSTLRYFAYYYIDYCCCVKCIALIWTIWINLRHECTFHKSLANISCFAYELWTIVWSHFTYRLIWSSYTHTKIISIAKIPAKSIYFNPLWVFKFCNWGFRNTIKWCYKIINRKFVNSWYSKTTILKG